eukprot:2339235-Amphidinium_carterae.1
MDGADQRVYVRQQRMGILTSLAQIHLSRGNILWNLCPVAWLEANSSRTTIDQVELQLGCCEVQPAPLWHKSSCELSPGCRSLS